MIQFRRLVATALIVSTASFSVPQPAYAGMLSTGTAIATAERDRIASVLNRADVRSQLETLGVNPADVKARIAALTDDEAAQLSRQIESLPAGADGGATVLGVLILVAVILVITDLLGVTHIFPFIKPIR
jgi:hypothetical protein